MCVCVCVCVCVWICFSMCVGGGAHAFFFGMLFKFFVAHVIIAISKSVSLCPHLSLIFQFLTETESLTWNDVSCLLKFTSQDSNIRPRM